MRSNTVSDQPITSVFIPPFPISSKANQLPRRSRVYSQNCMSFTTKEAARLLECTTAMITMLCRRKQLPATKNDAGQWIIRDDDLEQYALKKAFRVAAIAKFHGLHPETVRRWLRESKLEGTKEGQWVVKAFDLPKHRKSSKRSKKKRQEP